MSVFYPPLRDSFRIFFSDPRKQYFPGNLTGNFQDFPEDSDLSGRQIVPGRPKDDRSDPARTAFAKSPAADGGGTKVILGDSGGILQQEFLFGNKTRFPKSLLRQTSPWDLLLSRQLAPHSIGDRGVAETV